MPLAIAAGITHVELLCARIALYAAAEEENKRSGGGGMSLISTVPLTADEEVTLRRVAYGQSEERAMRREDLVRLRRLRLIEDGKDGPQLTAAGKERFAALPKAASLGSSGRYEDLLKTIDRRVPSKRR